MQHQQEDVNRSIEQVRIRREAAVAAREAAQAHSRQLQQRVSQAASLLETLQADPDRARVSTLPPPALPCKRFSMDDLRLPALYLHGSAIHQSVQQLLTQEASMQGCTVRQLAGTLGFDMKALPGSIRVVQFCDSSHSLLDHVFLYIHQGVHIHCLLARLRDAHSLLARCEGEPPSPHPLHSPAPFKRR
jgi:hypothetical protein